MDHSERMPAVGAFRLMDDEEKGRYWATRFGCFILSPRQHVRASFAIRKSHGIGIGNGNG